MRSVSAGRAQSLESDGGTTRHGTRDWLQQLTYSAAESQLADLIAEFGPPSRTSRAQSAAYPFTRLHADGVWVLNQDVQMDLVGPLASKHVTGRLEPSVESALRGDPALISTSRQSGLGNCNIDLKRSH